MAKRSAYLTGRKLRIGGANYEALAMVLLKKDLPKFKAKYKKLGYQYQRVITRRSPSPQAKRKTFYLLYGRKTKPQGYNARLDESLGSRRGAKSTKKQSYKSRRDESKGMEKSLSRRAYASVKTMDKKNRKTTRR